jgi:hypothetical protein
MQAAKAAAAAIRSIQPAIQEFNQASNDIRTSISTEMGIDAIQKEFRDIQETTRDSLRLDTPSFAPRTPEGRASTQDTDSASQPAEKVSAASGDGATSQNGSAADVGFTEEERNSLTAIAQELSIHDNEGSADSKGESSKTQGADAESNGTEDLERMRAESAAIAWGASAARQDTAEQQSGSRAVKKRLEDMTMAELEGELARRKEMIERINNLN